MVILHNSKATIEESPFGFTLKDGSSTLDMIFLTFWVINVSKQGGVRENHNIIEEV